MLIAGVDDAGSGSVIGPLTIAGVLMKEEDLPQLEELKRQRLKAFIATQARNTCS